MQNHPHTPGQFVSGRMIAMWTAILLLATALLEFVSIGVNSLQLVILLFEPQTAAAALADSGADIARMPGGEVQAAVLAIGGGTAMFAVPVLIAAVIVFLAWLYRAHANLRPLGVNDSAYSPGWVIGSWFVPVLNLVRPFQIIRYIWWKSDPDDIEGAGASSFPNRPDIYSGSESMLRAWWVFWLAGAITGRLAGRISWNAELISDYVLANWLGIFASILTIIAAWLAINVVRCINARQETRFRRLRGAKRSKWSQLLFDEPGVSSNFA